MHLWPRGQKTYVQIFKRLSGCEIIKQNMPGGMFLAPCIASILKNTAPFPMWERRKTSPTTKEVSMIQSLLVIKDMCYFPIQIEILYTRAAAMSTLEKTCLGQNYWTHASPLRACSEAESQDPRHLPDLDEKSVLPSRIQAMFGKNLQSPAP